MSKQQATLRAERRRVTGTGAARQLRRAGSVPAVVYGHGDESTALTLDAHEFERLLARVRAATTVIELDVEGGDKQQVLIWDIQRHPYRADVLHVDFFHIRADETIKISIPVHLEGEPHGVTMMGGILQQSRHTIEVECLPTDIPDSFTVDVSALDIGDSIHVGDLDAGGVSILDEADLTICTVVQPTVIEVEEPEELAEGLEGAEPGEEGEGGEDAREDDD